MKLSADIFKPAQSSHGSTTLASYLVSETLLSGTILAEAGLSRKSRFPAHSNIFVCPISIIGISDFFLASGLTLNRFRTQLPALRTVPALNSGLLATQLAFNSVIA